MAETETVAAPETAPETAPGSSPAPPGGTNGTPATPDWRASLPDDLRGHPSLADVKDVGGLAKRFVDTKAMVGDAVKIPGPEATPEQWAAYHKRIGVPDSPDKYEIKLAEMPKDHPGWVPESVAAFKGAAHQAGLTPQQAQALVDWYAKNNLRERDVSTAAAARQRQAEQAESIKAIEERWGTRDSLGWQEQVNLAERVIKQYFGGSPRMLEMLKFRGDDPVDAIAVFGLADIGRATQEARYLEGESIGGTESAEDLSKQIQELATEMQSGRVNPGSARYRDMLAQKDRLSQRHYHATRKA
jgi:hypothetical protein